MYDTRTPAAALLAIAFAVPLAIRASGSSTRAKVQLGASSLALLAMAILFPVLIPPVPLRILNASFANNIDRETLALSDTLAGAGFVIGRWRSARSADERVCADQHQGGGAPGVET